MTHPPTRLGRRGVFTPEIREAIVDSLRDGLSNRDAFRLVGISEATGYAWLERGRKALDVYREDPDSPVPPDELPYLEFYEEVEAALPAGKRRLVGLVSRDAEKNPESAKWLLVKKFPKEFGDTVRMTIDDELGGFLADCEAEFPADVLEKLLQVAARRLGGGPTGQAPK